MKKKNKKSLLKLTLKKGSSVMDLDLKFFARQRILV